MEWINQIVWPGFSGLIEILVMACGFYFLLLFFRETRSIKVFLGLLLILLALITITSIFHIYALNWLLRRLSVYLAMALLIIFQPEIRRALAEIGRQPFLSSPVESRGYVDSIIEAVMLLAERRIGALIAIERTETTKAIQETGVKLDARVNADLLATLFFPHTPLHDGGVIIEGNRIVAAGCLFPLCQQPELSRGLGTRHRAAMGLTEETDAIAIVVSEETGTISISTRGRISRDFDEDRLRKFLSSVLTKEQATATRWSRARQQLDLSPVGIAKSETLAREEGGHGG
ncbi:MAG: diadenylate cyclase CdaA [bacterium]